MATITLTRTGDRPLTFEGDQIASANSRWAKGQESNRWHELCLYETTTNKFVLHIAYRTQWQGELNRDEALILSDIADVAMELRAYDPGAGTATGPVGLGYEQFHQKQMKRLDDLRARYESAVSELLADMPERLE